MYGACPSKNGITTFHGGVSSYRPTNATTTAGSLVIARWSDGKVLVAQHGTMAGRVDIGFYPPSSAVAPNFWNSGTDGGALLANAVYYAATANVGAEPYCSGDGTATACPCGNVGAPGNGCASSINANGAELQTSGISRLSFDTLRLSGSGMPDGPALYLQGFTQSAGGLGVLFGDGLRCVSGVIVRLRRVNNVAGASQFPQAGDPSVSVHGLVTSPGTRTYQVWYRDAGTFCTPFTFNLTNGVQVTWAN